MVERGGYYFISRPRRFGKSLLLSTIEALFRGEKALFKDLWIERSWDWTQKNPVLHFSFNNIGHKELGLEKALFAEIDKVARNHQVELQEDGIARRFGELIEKVAAKGKVVVLIDEYDKPIIDYLGKEQLAEALKNQEILKSFYSVIKNSDDYLRFLLITGVSKFSKVGVFSDLNNLQDLTFNWRFAGMLGYTQEEVDDCFIPYREQILQRTKLSEHDLMDKLKVWYNGYTWDTETYVYNPFSILNFFEEGQFKNFWFSSGTPTFLINLMKDRFYYDFDGVEVGSTALESYDITKLETVPLLFQTGYLTIQKRIRNLYKMGYPNLEVKESMLQHLIGAFRHKESSRSAAVAYRIEMAFVAGNIEEVIERINGMFASIPYQLFEAHKESYYHSLIHLLFTYLGLYIDSEVNTIRGRADAIVQTVDKIYILEFKLDKSTAAAIDQIKERGYADKFQNSDKPVVAIGINFNSKSKRVEGWESEILFGV